MTPSGTSVETITGTPEEAAAHSWLGESLGRYNATFFGADSKPFTAVIQTREAGLQGAIEAWYVRGGSFFVDRLFIQESLRGTGLGRQLMVAAEACAREAECLHMRVATFSFQAPEFYRSLGFKDIASLPGGRDGDFEIFLLKEL